jgi:hypothetical protein
VGAIRNDYAAPKRFVSKAERQRREEARQARERQAIEQRARQREEEARQKTEREAVDAYLSGLDPDKRAALEAEVLAQADENARQTYENSALASYRETLMLALLREFVPQLLDEHGPVPVKGQTCTTTSGLP